MKSKFKFHYITFESKMPDARAAVLSICRKRGTGAYFRIRALESLWNKISSSPTPIPKRIWREKMSAHSLPVEFSRFVFENKLTLSVFVNMSRKISKHILNCKISCLPTFPVSAVSGVWLLQVITRKYRTGLCRTMTYAFLFWHIAWLIPAAENKPDTAVRPFPGIVGWKELTRHIQILKNLLDHSWFTYLTGSHHHLDEFPGLFQPICNCLIFRSFVHITTFYSTRWVFLLSANITNLFG